MPSDILSVSDRFKEASREAAKLIRAGYEEICVKVEPKQPNASTIVFNTIGSNDTLKKQVDAIPAIAVTVTAAKSF